MIEINFILGAAIYFIVWFLTLFLVLPFGVVAQNETDNIVVGTTESAPAMSHIGRKLLINTILAGAVFVAVYGLLTSDVLVNFSLPFVPEFGDK